jgi:hypothetical protein
MALGSTQPLTEMSTRNLKKKKKKLWVKCGRRGAYTACKRDIFTFLLKSVKASDLISVITQCGLQRPLVCFDGLDDGMDSYQNRSSYFLAL